MCIHDKGEYPEAATTYNMRLNRTENLQLEFQLCRYVLPLSGSIDETITGQVLVLCKVKKMATIAILTESQ
jgi:hypothetical protein